LPDAYARLAQNILFCVSLFSAPRLLRAGCGGDFSIFSSSPPSLRRPRRRICRTGRAALGGVQLKSTGPCSRSTAERAKQHVNKSFQHILEPALPCCSMAAAMLQRNRRFFHEHRTQFGRVGQMMSRLGPETSLVSELPYFNVRVSANSHLTAG